MRQDPLPTIATQVKLPSIRDVLHRSHLQTFVARGVSSASSVQHLICCELYIYASPFTIHWKHWRSCKHNRQLIASRLFQPACGQFDGESAPQPNPPRQKADELREAGKLSLVQEWPKGDTHEGKVSSRLRSLSRALFPGRSWRKHRPKMKRKQCARECTVLFETCPPPRNCLSCKTVAASVIGAALLRSFLGHSIAKSARRQSINSAGEFELTHSPECSRPVQILGAFLCNDRSRCAG